MDDLMWKAMEIAMLILLGMLILMIAKDLIS